jgi:hypothetical protein
MKVSFAKYTNVVPLKFGCARRIRDSHKCGGCYRKTIKSTLRDMYARGARRGEQSRVDFKKRDSS